MKTIEIWIEPDPAGTYQWVALFSDMPELGPLPTPFLSIMDVDVVRDELATMNPEYRVVERGEED